MAMNTNDGVPPEIADDFIAESQNVDAAQPAAYDGLDQFHSESQTSVEPAQAQAAPRLPLLEKETSHFGLTLATSAVALLLALVNTAVLLDTRRGGERIVRAPVEILTDRTPSHSESWTSPPVKAAVQPKGTAGSGVARPAPETAAPPALVETAPAARRLPSGASRATRRQRVLPRPAETQSTRGAQLPSGSVSAPSPPPPPAAPASAGVEAETPAGNQRSEPASTSPEPAAPEIGALVSVTTSSSNSDELTYRWGAPVGTFADATARETRFFCPEAPQSVAVTVTVTDASGAAASDTITVQCVASTR